MSEPCEVVGSFHSHQLAQEAIEALRRDGLDPVCATIIGDEMHTGEHVAGYYNLPQRAVVWIKRGAFWGGLWGLAFSMFLFWVPGIGLLLVAIPVVIGAITLGVLSGVAAVVYSMGIPHNSILLYAKGAQQGRYVVLFEGPAKQIRRARQILDGNKSLASVLNMPVLNGDTEFILPQ